MDSIIGVFFILVGIGGLLFRKVILPRMADRIADSQYRISRLLLGETIGRSIQRQYALGAQIGLLVGGVAFIVVGVLVLVGVIHFKGS